MKPDGDTIGSGLALASMLTRLGKNVTHCSIDKVPYDLMFMSGVNRIKITDKIKKAAETFDIKLIDHVIFADSDYYSYSDSGRL